MFIRHFAVETLPRGRTKPTPSWRAYPVEMVVGQEQKNKTASCYAHFDDLRPIVDIGRNARKVKLESLNMPRSVSIEIMGAPKNHEALQRQFLERLSRPMYRHANVT